MKKRNLKIIVVIIFILIIVAIFIIIRNNKKSIENETQPVVYYSFNDEAKKPMNEDSNAFSGSPKISWPNNCTGIIKKDGEEFSSEGDTLLVSDGSYEITVKSSSGRNKINKNIIIDKTPPEVEIKENPSGSYTIIFADVNDVDTAILTKLNLQTKKVELETDLSEGGLQENIEIKDKGYYILKVADKLGNLINGKTKFKIQ